MNANVIETAYNGYKFRSRLEARWAVFFDELGIKYQYEPEGFEHNGERYLPDFFLPEHDLYIEVKPSDYERIGEIAKAVEVCCRETGKVLAVFGEIPNITDCGIWIYNAFYYHPADKSCIYRPIILDIDDGDPVFHSDYCITWQVERRAHIFFEDLKRVHDRTGKYTISGISCKDFEQGSPNGTPAAYYPEDKAKEFRYCFYETETIEDFKKAKATYEKAKQARFEYAKRGEEK